MSAFLEERLDERIRLGASWEEDFNVEVSQTSSGREERWLVHPHPQYRFRVLYTEDIDDLWEEIVSLHRRVYGRFAGFRLRFFDEYSTNGMKGVPTAFDHELESLGSGEYQLVKRYGVGDTLLSVGAPVRTIYKPVAGTVKAGIRNATTGDHEITAFSVDTATGVVTLAANKSRAITAITKGATTTLTVGSNTFTVGDSAHVSGVVGMTQINGRRAEVVARTSTTVTLDIDSTGFSDYVSGGTVQTTVQAGETVHGGCEFDLPCRFDTPLGMQSVSRDLRETGEIEIVELIAL